MSPLRSGSGRIVALTLVACLAPVVVLIAALGTRVGAWDVAVGYDLLAWRVGPVVAVLGVAAALGTSVLARRARKGGRMAVLALFVSLTATGGFAWQARALAKGQPEDAVSDGAEPPGFGPLAARRAGRRDSGFADCPAARPVMTQSVPESVVYVLQREGVTVERAGVTGVYGVKRGFWFGFPQDVAVRIRPRRTDIRVAARDPRPQGGAACALAGRISAGLTPN